MCLVTYMNHPLVADVDLMVYKVLTLDNYSPYKDMKYKYGKNVAEGYGYTYPKICTLDGQATYEIEGGYLHAFLEWKDAIALTYQLKRTYDKRCFKVVEMYIPKGSKYWLGNYGDVCCDTLLWKGPKVITRIQDFIKTRFK